MEIIKGKIPKAQKVCLYGVEGIGKSTFAGKFPNPIFIDTEGSTVHLDVARFPKPEKWSDLYDQVDYVLNKALKGDFEYKTLVIDTLDWAEQLCMAFICTKHNVKGIESFGYGKGYTYLAEEWSLFLDRLQLVADAGVNVVCTAHAQIKKFERPDQDTSYDRYELKLQKKTAPLVKEWADALLFANYKVYVSVNQNNTSKAKSRGERVMYTTHHATHDAKNRWELVGELPFDYKEIEPHVFVGQDKGLDQKEDAKEDKKPKKKTKESKKEKDLDLKPLSKEKEKELEEMFGDRDPRLPNDELEGQTNFADLGKESKVKPELQALMDKAKVNIDDVLKAVYKRGYYPEGTPYENLEDSFIDGVLIGAWNNGLLQMIKDIKNQKEEF